jgi:hypothetical protein
MGPRCHRSTPSRRTSRIKAFAIGASRVGLNVKDIRICGEVGAKISQTVEFAPGVGEVIQKHRNIVIRILVDIAACARSEQNYALCPIAGQLIERATEAFQKRVFGDTGHDAFSLWRDGGFCDPS